MAASTPYTVNDTTPTLVFSGVGNVTMARVGGASQFVIGGSGLTLANGVPLSSTPFTLNVNSPDEIYAMSTNGTTDIVVLEVR